MVYLHLREENISRREMLNVPKRLSKLERIVRNLLIVTIWNSQTKTFSGNCEEVETLNADNSILIFCERGEK